MLKNIRHITRNVFLPGLFLAAVAVMLPVYAQDNSPPQAAPQASGEIELKLEEDIDPNEIPSLLFTYWEQTAIDDARRLVGKVRRVTPEELEAEMRRGGQGNVEKVKPPPEEREIKLGGIVFVDPEDWTIWLNGKRVTPQAIPEEVLDLQVYDEFIEVKWFDDYTNQILPIRLRPHQRFHIDTRMFLPG